MASIGTSIFAATRAVLKVALACGTGALAFKSGMFDAPSMKVMSGLYVRLLIPCLMFAKSAVAITPANVPYLVHLVAFSVGYLALGHVVGAVLVWWLRDSLPRHFRRTLIPVAAFGNHGDLILSILYTVGDSPPFRKGDAALGVALVAVFLTAFNVIFFSSGVGHFQADVAHLEVEEAVELSLRAATPVPEEDEEDVKRPASRSRDDAAGPSSSAAESTIPLVPLDESAASPPPLRPHSLPRRIAASLSAFFRRATQHPAIASLMNLPNLGLFLGLFVALVPGVGPLVAGSKSAPLSFLYDAADFLGSAAVPLSMTIFGASLTTLETDAAAWREFPGILRALVAVLVFRLVLMPVAGVAAVEAAVRGGWIPRDQKMLRFILMIEACVPTAQLCLIMTKFYHPRGEAKEVAAVMLAQYAACFVTLTASLSFILNLLSD
ncbi:Protein M3 [Blastocladiella emersonii ATCC 22665]|nr:Protein M3 [Blastocladiella emersonii ATCC 22665]